MIRTKVNLKPLVCAADSNDFTDNENVVDGVVTVSSPSDKLAVTALQVLDKLEQPTPFFVNPDVVVEGSET